jgi:hypothetical protein
MDACGSKHATRAYTHLLGVLLNDFLFQNILKYPKDIPFVSLTKI